MSTRRRFISQLSQASTLAFLPLHVQDLFAASSVNQDTIIDEVEIVRLTGSHKVIPGLHRQYQAKPIHIYPDQHPAPYSDNVNAKETTEKLVHDYLRIRTKGGLSGMYGAIDAEAITPILKQLRPFLIGKDALAGETLWDQLYRNNRHARAGHYMMALSAVDNTLWDLRGKKFNAPVYELLGGPTRKDVRVYGSCLGFTVEKGKVAPRAKQLYDQGFLHQKWFLAYSPGDGNAGLKKNIDLVEELRAALGFDAEIMFDAYMGWDLPFATAWCKAVEKFRPYWIEEAFSPERLDNFIQLSRSTSIPVATGEHFYGRWEAQNFLREGAIQIVQADPEWCGGVSELVKICNIASSFGAKVFPHGHAIHATLHVVASQSPEVCPLVEYLINHVAHKMHFQKEPLLTTNGILPLPQKPGFGIALDEAKIESQQVITS
ncbi:enolase C-terminal domain-like protein [Chryseolinea sp. H1M3-3]|uniref:enolase C-terminal domain-like protein n=1 Tax=Chryseolinea sp. H1M3-3 TaxID=3034144 RepID=UPI0023ECF691|nr:enolase C-terminal domain-like protein [Chryseolinea sp. H1M3-3]